MNQQSITQPSQSIDPAQIGVKDTFGLTEAPDSYTIDGFNEGHYLQHMVPVKRDYTFNKDRFQMLNAWFQDPQGDGLSLHGPTGSGKTSIINQYCNRLNWPVFRVNSHSRLEVPNLVGHHKIENGDMKFVYGPLALAMMYGGVFVWDEQDLSDPSVSAGVNAVLEGEPLMLEDNGGELIHPHENFRFVITGNSAGGGDDSMLHVGVQQQNIAFMDRFVSLAVDYLTPDEELLVLSSKYPQMDGRVLKTMIDLANNTRETYIGNPNSKGQLGVVMSTRTIIRWANYAQKFVRYPQPLHKALDFSLTNKAQTGDKKALNEMAATLFGRTEWEGA